MNQLFILDAGRADCSVIFFDTPSGRKTVIIDGGTIKDRESPLLPFLKKYRVDKVELLILTHLHQDHFGGFYDLIDRIQINRAIAPCGDLVFCKDMYPYYANSECFREYHQIFEYMATSRTKLEVQEDLIGTEIKLGNCTLHCLYPTQKGQQRGAYYANRLCCSTISQERMQMYCSHFQSFCNADSSIWGITCSGQDIALFSGDCTAETMDLALSLQPFHPKLLKLSHHGINTRYFSQENLAKISPQVVVVPVSKGYYESIKKDCEAVCAPVGAKLYYTFEGDYQMSF